MGRNAGFQSAERKVPAILVFDLRDPLELKIVKRGRQLYALTPKAPVVVLRRHDHLPVHVARDHEVRAFANDVREIHFLVVHEPLERIAQASEFRDERVVAAGKEAGIFSELFYDTVLIGAAGFVRENSERPCSVFVSFAG